MSSSSRHAYLLQEVLHFGLPEVLELAHALHHGVRRCRLAPLAAEQLVVVDDRRQLLRLPRRHRVRLGQDHERGRLDRVQGAPPSQLDTTHLQIKFTWVVILCSP